MQVKTGYFDIWRIAYPIIIGSLAQTLLNLIDTAFLARVGEVELGASAIAGVFYFVLVMLGMAIGVGTQIIIARKAGENKPREIGSYFDHGVLFLVSVSVLLFLLMKFISPLLFGLILHNRDIEDAADLFMQYRCFGFFFIMLSVSFRSFYTGIAQTKIIIYSSVIMTMTNIVLDYLLIFGNFGFPKMGIAGAGLASAISEFVAAVYIVLYTLAKSDIDQFYLFRFEKIRKSTFLEIFKISSPLVLQNLISMGAWFLFFVFIERMGKHELAISNIIRSMYMILMTPIWGYSAAANSMVSNVIGQGKESEVIRLVKKIALMSLVTTFFILIISYISPVALLRIVTSDGILISDSLGSFHVISAAMLFFSVSMIILSAVSGTGKTQVAMLIEYLILLFTLHTSTFAWHWSDSSLETVWASEIIYWVIMGVSAFWYMKSKRWMSKTEIKIAIA